VPRYLLSAVPKAGSVGLEVVHCVERQQVSIIGFGEVFLHPELLEQRQLRRGGRVGFQRKPQEAISNAKQYAVRPEASLEAGHYLPP
jgi:hypothetical protein